MEPTRRKRSLAILGAYGGVNSGDEMILRAAARLARAAGYADEIAVIGAHQPAPPADLEDYREQGLKLVRWRNLGAAIAAVAGRDLFIGGGQLIDGAAGVQNPLLKALLAAVARVTGGRVSIGGVSTANLDRAAVRAAYRLLFGMAGRINTRDRGSLAEILTIAPSAAGKAESLADLVFGLRDELEGPVPARERRTVTFAIHHAPHLALTDFDLAAAFLARLRALSGPHVDIVILAHDIRENFDRGLGQRLVDRLGSDRLSLKTLSTTADCIAFYRAARTVVSMRMHPIILASCAGAFCVPLTGSRKLEDMAARLALPQWRLETLIDLPDSEFRKAVGLDDDGPLADPREVRRLADEARAVRIAGEPAAIRREAA